MASYKQPVIPEIAKAFENDPRTRLAQQAIATGVSTAPVATGGWAWADGLARALQGVAGGYMQRQQLKKYKEDEDALLALRQARGNSGLASLGDTASQAAAVLGAPPPQAPQPAPQPAAPVAPPPQAAPAPQGGPQGAPMAPGGLPPAPAPQGPPAAPQRPPMAMVDPNNAAAGLPGIVSGYGGGTFGADGRPVTDKDGNPVQGPQGVAFVHPLGGKGRATGRFGDARPGHTHNGLDLAIDAGTPVAAAGEGTVLRAWNDTKNGGGNSVLIRHPDGSVTGYAHLASFNVARGDTVSAGQPIGAVGTTGRSTGPHLHFTYRDPSGKRVNPSALQFGQPGQSPQMAAAGPGNTRAPVPGVTTPEPTPEAMPEAPTLDPATRSPRLASAYRLMADGNRYESAGAMDMYDKGLGEQGAYNEAAAGRKAEFQMTGYRAGLDRFNTDRSQRTAAAWDARRDERQNGFNVANREDTQAFEADQQTRTFAHDMERAGYDRETAMALARLNNDADWRRTQAQIEAARGTAEDKAAARRNGFFNTPTGAKLYDAATQRMNDNASALDQLSQFEALNKQHSTGGAILGNAPGLVTWASGDLQAMEGISQDMSIKLSGALKGAVSDKEGERILKALPSIRQSPRANAMAIQRIRRALQRANDFETRRLEAIAGGGQIQFAREWDAYRNSVSIDEDKSFDDWKGSLPSYGADGRRMR